MSSNPGLKRAHPSSGYFEQPQVRRNTDFFLTLTQPHRPRVRISNTLFQDPANAACLARVLQHHMRMCKNVEQVRQARSVWFAVCRSTRDQAVLDERRHAIIFWQLDLDRLLATLRRTWPEYASRAGILFPIARLTIHLPSYVASGGNTRRLWACLGTDLAGMGCLHFVGGPGRTPLAGQLGQEMLEVLHGMDAVFLNLHRFMFSAEPRQLASSQGSPLADPAIAAG